jgi:hypothetical protein
MVSVTSIFSIVEGFILLTGSKQEFQTPLWSALRFQPLPSPLATIAPPNLNYNITPLRIWGIAMITIPIIAHLVAFLGRYWRAFFVLTAVPWLVIGVLGIYVATRLPYAPLTAGVPYLGVAVWTIASSLMLIMLSPEMRDSEYQHEI